MEAQPSGKKIRVDYERAQALWAYERAYGPSHRMHRKVLGRYLHRLLRGRRVLDAGCGDGFFSRLLEKSNKVISCDLAASAAALTATRRNPGAPVARASVLELPFPDGAFDAVVALEVFEHIEEDRAAVLECVRVLRPSGLLVFSVPAGPELYCRIDREDGHYRRYSAGDLRRRLLSGLELVDFRAFGFPLMRAYYRVLPRLYSVEAPPQAVLGPPARVAMGLLYAAFHLDLLFEPLCRGVCYYGAARRLEWTAEANA